MIVVLRYNWNVGPNDTRSIESSNEDETVSEITTCVKLESIYISERCYWIVDGKHDFKESHRLCQVDDGILAEVPDDSVQEAVNKQWLSILESYWIGVHDMYSEYSFVNMLNETITYAKWGRYQPNNIHGQHTNADCVLDEMDFGWIDTVCSFEYPAICSKRVTCKFNRNLNLRDIQ
ncbi:tetranectin-like protein [Ostrea edulis]|uniref:tetranectin-like protein n=1 Tax=Ostrea edulis TaxID=37623 RepID=UPI0024AF088B|nr:tetranectin-like protein [Ostrea edulis]